MPTMSTTYTNDATISDLIINKVPNQDVFDAMRENGDIQANQLYFVEGPLPELRIGNKVYNGTTSVQVDVYNGSYTIS